MPKTIRVFISSTFRDMHAERDYISRIVFPELRSRCLKRGADFIGFDLRWGITEEEAEREGALAVCLQEIERCRPFFVCLLGDRFGWVPPPDEIPTFVFESIRNEGLLPSEIAEWYRLDETTEPPVYRLRRDRKVPSDVTERLARFWEDKGLPLAGDSITAREILRGVFEEGYPPTRALFYLRRSGVDQNPAFPSQFVPVFVEQDAHRREKLGDLKARIQALSGRVTVRDYEARYAGLRIDAALLPGALSERARAALADGVVSPQEWSGLSAPARQAFETHGTVALSGMEALAERIEEDLWRAIEPELDRAVERLDAHQRERAYHERFVTDRTRLFLGRHDVLQRMMRYIGDPDDRLPLVVSGAPGSGKSALLAECARRARQSDPGALVIPHFIGVAPASTALPSTLRSLCETLRRECDLEEAVPEDPLKLSVLLPVFLEKAGVTRRVVLVLDALNQLDPAGRSHELGWFPFRVPPGVRVIVSALPGDCLDRLKRRVPEVVEVPVLPEDDRRTLVAKHLEVRRKKLTAEQLDRLLDSSIRTHAGLPLYLLVALEELCLFGDYEQLNDRIQQFPPTVPELFEQVLARLEQDHGHEMVESVCRWLAASRSGLLEPEVLDLLAGDGPAFPRARWTRFYRALEFYLQPVEETTGAGLLGFFHDQLRFAVYRRYLGMASPVARASDTFRSAHQGLAAYFGSVARPQDDPQHDEWRTDRPRGLSELPHHLTRGELWEELEDTLCDHGFVDAKCRAGMVGELLHDFADAMTGRPATNQLSSDGNDEIARYVQRIVAYSDRPDGPVPTPPSTSRMAVTPSSHALSGERPYERLRAWHRFVADQAGPLARGEAYVYELAYNSEEDGPVAGRIERLYTSGTGPGRPWMRLLNRRPYVRSSSMMALEVDGMVRSVAISADGRRALSASDGAVQMMFTLADARLWDVDSGESRPLIHHIATVAAVDMTPDGRYAITGSVDGSIGVWDLQTFDCEAIQIGSPVSAVATTPSARWIVLGTLDGSVYVVERNKRPLRLTGHATGVTSVAISADGKCALSAAAHPPVLLHDLVSLHARELGARDEPPSPWDKVSGVALTPDSSHALSASRHGVRVWDLRRDSYDFHKGRVDCAALTPDGRLLIFGRGAAIYLRDLERGGERRGDRLVGDHVGNQITAVAITPDGRRAASGGNDRRLRVWDLEHVTGDEARAAHLKKPALFSSDGRSVACRGEDGLSFWDITTDPIRQLPKVGPQVQTSPTAQQASSLFAFTAIAQCSSGFVSVAREGVRVWDLARTMSRDLGSSRGLNVEALQVTPDGRRVVIAWGGGGIEMRDLHTGESRNLDDDPEEGALPTSVVALALTPDGKHAVAGLFGGITRVWNLESGSSRCLERRGYVDAMGVIGNCAFTQYQHGALLAWNFHTNETWEMQGEWPLAASRDSRFLAYAAPMNPDGLLPGARFPIVLEDRRKGQSQELTAHHGAFTAMAFTADASKLISAAADDTLRIWDLESGVLLATHVSTVGVIKAITPHFPYVLATGKAGVELLVIHGISAGIQVATARRLWLFGAFGQTGRWDDDITFDCDSCGARAIVPDRARDACETLMAASPGPKRDLLRLTAEMPELNVNCAQCGVSIRIAVFLADDTCASAHSNPSALESVGPQRSVDRLEEEEDFTDTLRRFKAAIAAHVGEDEYAVHYDLGIAYFVMGLFDEGIEEFHIARNDPQRALDTASMLGLSYVEKGLYEQAIQWFRDGLTIAGAGPEAHAGLRYYLALAFEAAGDVEAALVQCIDLQNQHGDLSYLTDKVGELMGQVESFL